MAFVKISEQPSLYNDLEKKSVLEILTEINQEDHKVADAVQKAIPQIEKLVTAFFLLNGIIFDILALQDRSFLHKLFIWKSIAQVSHVTVLRLLRVVAHGRTDEFFRDVIAIKLRTLQSGFEIDDLRIDQ